MMIYPLPQLFSEKFFMYSTILFSVSGNLKFKRHQKKIPTALKFIKPNVIYPPPPISVKVIRGKSKSA